MTTTDDFTPDEINTDFCEFKKICKKKKLNEKAIRWLNEWNSLDFACSPMEDENRKIIRYGHYLGWYEARSLYENTNIKNDNQTLSQAVDDAHQRMVNSNGYGY